MEASQETIIEFNNSDNKNITVTVTSGKLKIRQINLKSSFTWTISPSPCFVFLQILPRIQVVKIKLTYKKICRPVVWAKGKTKEVVILAVVRRDIHLSSGKI